MPLLKCHPENSSQLLSQVITYLSSKYSIWGFSRNLVPKVLEMRFFSPVSRMDPWTWFKALLCDCLFVLLLLPRSCTFFSVQPASKQHFLDAKLIWGEIVSTVLYIFCSAPMKTFSFTPVSSVENSRSLAGCHKERDYLK